MRSTRPHASRARLPHGALTGIAMLVALCTPAWSAEPLPSASTLPASTLSDADKASIRDIVKDVLREYSATLGPSHAGGGGGDAREILGEITAANRDFMRGHNAAYFKPFTEGQHPRATVVTCSDSRVHTHALDKSPDGDLFMVRNIGNQIATAEGSVEYGVHHLHTPLLLIVGHVACGAIKAASGDYGKESFSIRRELDTIQIDKGESGISGVKRNVNNQVKFALNKFEQEVASGKLTVIGAVYDFRNELKQGQGKLVVVNVNGELDPTKIAALEVMIYTPPPAGKAHAAPKAAHH
jgi:carbonic anhydrase